MHEVETERLLLRPAREDDLEAFHRVLTSDPQVMRWLATGEPMTLEQTAERFPSVGLAHWRERGYGVWMVCDRATGELLGHCGVRFVDESGEDELLYALGTEHWGKGYATEAARASVRFAFEVAGLDRVTGYILPGNDASRRVLEKAGLSSEGDDFVFGHDVHVLALSYPAWEPDGARFVVREVPS